ncbi:MAG: hypothetical protein BA867_09120 [Desulfobacterales bacterium S5133MH16]|nr:MAG: hypothetical protein BA867_09120 [Desulfobacterales bacterium S5133MH16]
MKELLEFIKKYSDIPKKKIIVYTLVAGISYALILSTVNLAIGADVGSQELRLFFLLLTLSALHLYSKKHYMNSTSKLAGEIIKKIRINIIEKIRHTELRFLETAGKGEIYTRLTEETESILRAAPSFTMAMEGIVSFAAIFTYMIFLFPHGAIFICILMSMSIIFYTLSAIPARRKLTSSKIREAELLDKLNDVLAGFKEIRINHKKNEDLFADFKAIAKEAEKLKADAMITLNDSFMLINIAFLGIIGGIIFMLPIIDIIENSIVISLVSSLLFLWGPMMTTFSIIPQYLIASVAIANIEKLEALIDNFDPYIPEKEPEAIADFKEITLNSVTFCYNDEDGDLLFQMGPLDFSLKKNEIIFIAGGNGSGKTTLMRLLTGLYYPEDGSVSIDGSIVTRQTYQSYRDLFSTIFTDFYIFKKLYGMEDIDENNVNELLRKMEIEKKTEYIKKSFTNINLSTGQRKRLAYITALLEDKQIYVFDEWAADQDPEFRKKFYNRFLNDMRLMGKTVIAVSHDDRYFDRADKVIKMEMGKIVTLT